MWRTAHSVRGKCQAKGWGDVSQQIVEKLMNHGLHEAAEPQPGIFFTRITQMGPPDKAAAMQTCRSAPKRERV